MTLAKDTLLNVQDQYDEIQGAITTDQFATVLTINAILPRESTFVIHNKGSGDLDYRILGNLREPDIIVDPPSLNFDDEGWVILDFGSIETNLAPDVLTLSNPYSRVVAQIKHSVSTTTSDIYHRGEI